MRANFVLIVRQGHFLNRHVHAQVKLATPYALFDLHNLLSRFVFIAYMIMGAWDVQEIITA